MIVFCLLWAALLLKTFQLCSIILPIVQMPSLLLNKHAVFNVSTACWTQMVDMYHCTEQLRYCQFSIFFLSLGNLMEQDTAAQLIFFKIISTHNSQCHATFLSEPNAILYTNHHFSLLTTAQPHLTVNISTSSLLWRAGDARADWSRGREYHGAGARGGDSPHTRGTLGHVSVAIMSLLPHTDTQNMRHHGQYSGGLSISGNGQKVMFALQQFMLRRSADICCHISQPIM